MDAWPTFWSHNEPLFNEMIKKGFKFKRDNKLAYFVDSEGEYANFPVGYITGPGVDYNNGNPRPWYASVNGHNGWAQRSGKNQQEVVAWALEKGKEVLQGTP